jgi:hypothetical protein
MHCLVMVQSSSIAVWYVSDSPQELQVTFFAWSSFVILIACGDAFQIGPSGVRMTPPLPLHLVSY